MEITKDTKIIEILKEYPWISEKAKEIDPRLDQINTPFGKMMAKKLTVADAAKLGKMDVQYVIEQINFYIDKYTKEENEELKK